MTVATVPPRNLHADGEKSPSTSEREPPRWRFDLGFVALCVAISAVRFVIIDNHGAPVGIDSGNWLALGHDLLGRGLRSSTIVYPPVIPLLVTGAVNLLGVTRGAEVVTIVLAVAPAVGCYLVLRSWGLAWWAVALSGLLAAASSAGEAAAWGGFPQLLALGATVVFVWLLDRYLRTAEPGDALKASLALALITGSSHFLTLAAAVTAAVLVTFHLVFLRAADRAKPFTRILLWAPLILLPSVPLMSTYMKLATGVSDAARSTASGGALDQLGFLFRDFPLLWRGAVLVALVTPVLLFGQHKTARWMIPASLLVAGTATAAAMQEPRFLNLLPLAAVIALGTWVAEIEPGAPRASWRTPLAFLLTASLATQVFVGLRFFSVQIDYYGVLDPGSLEAMEWARMHTASNSSIAISPPKTDAVLGWWAEAVIERRTFYATRLVWLNFEDEQRRARIANQIFAEDFPNETTLKQASDAHIDYLFVAKAWPGYHSTRVDQFTEQHPDTVVYQNNSALILKVGDPK